MLRLYQDIHINVSIGQHEGPLTRWLNLTLPYVVSCPMTSCHEPPSLSALSHPLALNESQVTPPSSDVALLHPWPVSSATAFKYAFQYTALQRAS